MIRRSIHDWYCVLRTRGLEVSEVLSINGPDDAHVNRENQHAHGIPNSQYRKYVDFYEDSSGLRPTKKRTLHRTRSRSHQGIPQKERSIAKNQSHAPELAISCSPCSSGTFAKSAIILSLSELCRPHEIVTFLYLIDPLWIFFHSSLTEQHVSRSLHLYHISSIYHQIYHQIYHHSSHYC